MDFKTIRLGVWIAGGFLLVAYGINFYYAIATEQSGGTFGDTFGAANALFSGAALFFLIQAFLLQREELSLVREERNDTRALLEGQETLVAEQMAALSQQTFERSFLSQLELLLEEKRRLEEPIVRGGGRFSLLSDASRSAREVIGLMEQGSLSADSSNWPSKTMDLHNARFLLRSFLTLGDLIASSSVTEKVKERYTGLLVALADEKIALCVAALSVPDLRHMDRVNEYYRLFETYDLNRFLSPADSESFRNACAVAETLSG